MIRVEMKLFCCTLEGSLSSRRRLGLVNNYRVVFSFAQSSSLIAPNRFSQSRRPRAPVTGPCELEDRLSRYTHVCCGAAYPRLRRRYGAAVTVLMTSF